MTKLKTVGVREFRDRATTYLSGTDPVAVSRHGHIVGFYIPLGRDENQSRRALDRLGQTVEKILAETGLSEQELVELFDLRRSLPK